MVCHYVVFVACFSMFLVELLCSCRVLLACVLLLVDVCYCLLFLFVLFVVVCCRLFFVVGLVFVVAGNL